MEYPEDYDYENSTMPAEVRLRNFKIYIAENIQVKNDHVHVEIILELESEN